MRFWIYAILLSFCLLSRAQNTNWRTAEDLPGVDFTSLNPDQKQLALKLLREHDCTCECGMKAAECRVVDPNCSYSKGLAAIAVDAIRAGKSPTDIAKALDEAPHMHRPKLLEDPVDVPSNGSPARGPSNARITLVEFSDFECPYCSLAAAELKSVFTAYPKDVRVIFKQFPLSMHPNAPLAAAASLAANDQGKFWEMHDKLFANFKQLSREHIFAWAQQMGLDMARFTHDVDSGKYKAIIDRDVRDGENLSVYGTPSFFINGKRYNGAFALETVKPILDAELKSAAPRTTAAR